MTKIVDQCGAELTLTQTDSDTIDAKVHTDASKIDDVLEQDEYVGVTFTRSGTDIETSVPLAQHELTADDKRGQSRYGVVAQHNPMTKGVKLHYPKIQEEPKTSLRERN